MCKILQIIKHYNQKSYMLKIWIFSLVLLAAVAERRDMNYNMGSATQSVDNMFGSNHYQVPDGCPDPGPHLYYVQDQYLHRNAIAHLLHYNGKIKDNDRCQKMDRQRNQMSVTGSSPSFMYGRNGDHFSYAWKVFVPASFSATNNFCHIHQIKLDGGNTGGPNMTISLKASGAHLEQVNEDQGTTVLASTPLGDFVGHWLQIKQSVTFGHDGKINLIVTRMRDGATVLNYHGSVKLGCPSGKILRPKFGFYRKNVDGIKDEEIRTVDLCVSNDDGCFDSFNNFGAAISQLEYQQKHIA